MPPKPTFGVYIFVFSYFSCLSGGSGLVGCGLLDSVRSAIRMATNSQFVEPDYTELPSLLKLVQKVLKLMILWFLQLWKG